MTLVGGTNITTTRSGDTIVFDATGLGEINTGSNVGGGAEVFKQKIAEDLIYRTLIAGTGIDVVQQTDTILISLGSGQTTPIDNPCDEDPGDACGDSNFIPADENSVGGMSLLKDDGTPVTKTIEAMGTNSITPFFMFDSIQKEQRFSLEERLIAQQFACADKFPLESGLPTSGVSCPTNATVKIKCEIISNPCGIDEVIHEEIMEITGFNPNSFKKSQTFEWNNIDNTGCLNKFPGTLIGLDTNTRCRFTRLDSESSGNVYFMGYNVTHGDDWFDGGNNKSSSNKYI